MSYEYIASRMQLRPIDRWPGDLLAPHQRQRSPFDGLPRAHARAEHRKVMRAKELMGE